MYVRQMFSALAPLLLVMPMLSACSETPTPTTDPTESGSTSNTPGPDDSPDATATVSPTVSANPSATIEPDTTETDSTDQSSTTEDSQTYSDPDGKFAVPIPTNWQATPDDGFVLFTDPDEQIKVYALVIESDDPVAAIADAWKRVDPSFVLEPKETQELPPGGGVEKLVATNYDDGNQERFLAGLAQMYQGTSYVLLVDGPLADIQRRSSQIAIIQSGFDILALEEADLSAAQPLPVTPQITAQIEEYINDVMAAYKIPGAVVAIVQGDEVVYSKGFGVRNDQGDPMTPETRMMIGSTGKSLTTLMMATLVDDGTITWDTPAQQILPSFAVKDPELSQQITMRNLVCACTGVPRRDFELIFNAQQLTAEDIVASLSDFEFFTEFGEAFQYSNQMVGAGGYIAAIAANGQPDDFYTAYTQALQARVLDPIGMTDTTLSFAEVQASDNYALPHSTSLAVDNVYQTIPLSMEQILTPIAPAGAHWSTALDMSKYMITQINQGIAPDGAQVASAKNMNVTWQPQVPVDAETSYGLGWFVSSYKGQQLIEHGGNTLGFTSSFGFLPNAKLGIIVLTNGQGANGFSESVRARLFELVFEQLPEAEAQAMSALQLGQEQFEQIARLISDTLDVEAISPFVGQYANDALGEISIVLENDRLFFDAGEFQSELKTKLDDAGAIEGYIMVEPPLTGALFKFQGDAAAPTIVLGKGADVYTFTKSE
ncbi:MAG: beta-lactamase family protein [Chloroflexales bacterium]|nr:beta-lactamase family protein [Chloroflexales bacterium]